ncbi:MAG: SusC/RagA family TonB-linked outer membrane protein [Ferruginibacter sp.]
MRRFLSLFTLLMLSGVLAFAQSRVVNGKISDANGNPVSFATVKVKGTNQGLSADANGAYSIKVNPSDVLVISGASFKEVEVPVGTQTTLNTVMERSTTSELKEVVVTGAFGTKRVGRSVASNVQNIDGDQLNTIRQSNINNAIAGKAAGAQVRSQSAAKLGVETQVRLRGENGLGSGGGALYVVDGTIMPSANDINPDDIEDITVLQGPAAAALFGPDGANGAIVVNTKKAKKGTGNIGIEINSGIVFDKIYITPAYQNTYAGGAEKSLIQYNYKAGDPEGWKALDGKYFHDLTDDASWGPRMMGQEYAPWYAWYGGHERSYKTAALVAQPNNNRDFYNTGVTKTNNINISKATDNLNLRLSYTNLDQKGMVPTEFLKRHTVSLNATIDVTPRIIVGASINYIAQDRNAENNDGYANQSAGGFGQWFHRDLDMGIMRELGNLRTPDGVMASWNPRTNPDGYTASDPGGFYKANYWYNYYGYFNEIKNPNRRDRLYGDVSVTYKLTNDLKIKGTYRKNQLNVAYESITSSTLENSGLQTGSVATYQVGQSRSDRQNYEGLITYSKKIKSFAVNVIGGFDILNTTFRREDASTSNGLNIPGLYSLSNSASPIVYGRGLTGADARQQSKRRSLFARADIGFRNLLFVEGSYRRDYVSTEPADTYIETKSVGASFVFSDLTRKAIPFISYGKIRGSYGQLLNALGIYDLNQTYVQNATQWNAGNFLLPEPNTLVDPDLRGAANTEKEIGLEMRFAKNRFGFNVTYWDRTNKDFPVNVTIPGQTGYTGVRVNAGEIAKNGIDIQAFVNPIRSKNIDWNITASYGRLLKNEVVSIAPGITRLVSSSGAFSGSSAAYTVSEVGQPWGQVFGGGIQRDASGIPVLTSPNPSTGDPGGKFIKQSDTKFGSALPDYTGGVQSALTVFKNFTLNINIDFSYGGKFFSLSDHWGTFSGLTARTAVLNDKGNSVRDDVADGGGVHVAGVDATTGKAVDYYIEAQDYFHQFRNARIAEDNIYDLTFVKLRELSLGYRIPVERLGIGKYIKNAVFSVISRNPWLIYAKTRDFDPSEISNVYGEDGQFPGTRSIGVNLKLGF